MSFINQCVIAKLTRLIAQSWSTIKQLETEKRFFLVKNQLCLTIHVFIKKIQFG